MDNRVGRIGKAVFFDTEVYYNAFMERLRESDCLCLNCGNLKPGQPDNCRIAQQFYEICVKENTALAVTRCPVWVPKEV